MRNIVKGIVVTVVLAIGLIAFFFTRKAEVQTLTTRKAPETILAAKSEVDGYKNWTKVNDQPQKMLSRISSQCARATPAQEEAESTNPHKDKYVNVFVNAIGEREMLTKKSPKFPVGTVVVKEKLASPDSEMPELLTVMIKRGRGFNPEVGDWEFMVVSGDASEVTAKGKLENCQTCHLDYKQNDYLTREYLPDNIEKKLK
jgi:hypothetical protein